MKAIFFDLETTTLSPLGQILNYAFVETDQNYNILSELRGNIELAKMEIPEPRAIAANCVDIREHMKGQYQQEYYAMRKIRKYIMDVVDHNPSNVMLVGHNIAKFDLGFLRTSMIRNGVSPWFGKNLIYGDTRFLAVKVFISEPSFRELLLEDKPEDIRAFSLEHMCNRLGLIAGKQEHESYSDVLNTIDFCKELRERYDLDLFEYDPYEVKSTRLGAQATIDVVTHDYQIESRDVMLLDSKKNYALWVDIEKYFQVENKQEAVYWYNKGLASMISSQTQHSVQEDKLEVILKHVLEERPVWSKCDTFFELPPCDVEQHIYNLNIRSQMDLTDAIERDELHKLTDPLAKKLFFRHKIRHQPELFGDLYKKYMNARYVEPKIRIDKGHGEERYTKSLSEMISEFSDVQETKENSKALQVLMEYYLSKKDELDALV